MFRSKLPLPVVPDSDVFTYIFHQGRRKYSADRVLYRVDGIDETLTLRDLEERARRLAHALRVRYDINSNDVVSIFATDKIQYPVAYFGCLATGATLALIPVQNEQTEMDIVCHLKQVNAKLLISDSNVLRLAETASKLCGDIPLITFDACPVHPSLDTILESVDFNTNIFEIHSTEQAEEHNAFINRTSGSTGNMKSVLISDAHFIATMEATKRTIPENTNPDTDVWVSSLSLGFFINAKLHMGLNILLGIPVVFMRGPLDASTIGVVPRHRITFLFITPPLAAKLARADMSTTDVSSVKWLLTAGAPMHENLRRTVSEQFGGTPLTLEWGTAETMLIAIQLDGKTRKPGSSGTLVNGLEAQVIDPQTRCLLGVNVPGEILIRNVLAKFKGYKDNTKANMAAFDDEGWFHTGDYGYLDEDSNVYIVDRMKELIKAGDGYGSHVSAAELEALLFGYEAIDNVIVVGIRDERTQLDRPTAFIVLKPEYREQDQRQLAREIQQFADQNLTGLRQLTGGVHFIHKLPVKGFKIDRRTLREMVNVVN